MASKKKEENTSTVKIENLPTPTNVPSIVLEQLTTTSFGGFDRSKPLVIDFSKSNGKKITMATGDQGVGKTSYIHSLLYACGQTFDFKLENFINNSDKTLAGEFCFKSDGRSYKVVYTKTKFELYKLFRDADDPKAEPTWLIQGEPKSLLKKLLGHVATSPMFLKTEKGDKQVEWLYSILNIPEETKKREVELREILNTATTGRTDANKDYEKIKSALSQNPLYLNWEASEAKYKEVKTIDSAKAKLTEVDLRRQKYTTAENGLATLKKDLKKKDQDIADREQELSELEAKIVLLKKEKTTLEKRLTEGDKYIKENKGVNDEYQAAYKEFTEINEFVIGKQNWQNTKQLKAEMDQFETAVQDLDVRKKDTRIALKNLVTEILPPIEGLEVELEKQIDSKRDVGIYLNGKTPAQLSESELISFYLQVCRSQGINMVFVENVSNLGSFTIDTLNALAEEGVLIFATMMNRDIKELSVQFISHIK